jgi:hypothetical protein
MIRAVGLVANRATRFGKPAEVQPGLRACSRFTMFAPGWTTPRRSRWNISPWFAKSPLPELLGWPKQTVGQMLGQKTAIPGNFRQLTRLNTKALKVHLFQQKQGKMHDWQLVSAPGKNGGE